MIYFWLVLRLVSCLFKKVEDPFYRILKCVCVCVFSKVFFEVQKLVS